MPRVIRALIAAQRADLDLDFDRACAIDLAGRDVLDAVQTSVNPKVIDCPDAASGKSTLSQVLLGLRRPTAGKVLFDGKEKRVIKVADIEARELLKQSSMPEGLAGTMAPVEFLDLMEYIASLK